MITNQDKDCSAANTAHGNILVKCSTSMQRMARGKESSQETLYFLAALAAACQRLFGSLVLLNLRTFYCVFKIIERAVETT